MTPTVLLSAPYMLPLKDGVHAVLKPAGVEMLTAQVTERLDEEGLMPFAGQVDGVICGDDQFSKPVLKAFAPRLKVISKWGTGIDSIDLQAAQELGVQVFNTPGAFTEAVADSVMGYVLAFARRLPALDRAMKAGEWLKLPGRALHECSLGVIGVGNCGKAVLRRARGFGMALMGNDIITIDPEFIEMVGVRMVALQELLSNADFVSLNCDLNPTSYHLLGAGQFGIMRPGSVLINCARGPVVDEAALIEALRHGRLGGAALDVFEREPLSGQSPLLGMDNVLLAPHNANSSPAAWRNVHVNTLRNLFHGLSLPWDDSQASALA